MPLEALLIPDNLTYSASDGIGGGTGCNFIFLTLVVFECYLASVELNFEPFMYVVSEKPPMCHHSETMCQIKNRI